MMGTSLNRNLNLTDTSDICQPVSHQVICLSTVSSAIFGIFDSLASLTSHETLYLFSVREADPQVSAPANCTRPDDLLM